MRRIFGAKKEKPPAPTVEETSEKINEKCEIINGKIKKLEAELSRYREQIKKTRPGSAQEAIKARALRVLKQKKMYEGQRDMFYNQAFSLDQIAFAAEGIKDAQQTMTAVKVANKDISGTLKALRIDDIDKMQEQLIDLVGYNVELQDSLGQNYNVPNGLDEEELLGELDALEADMGIELQVDEVPSYLQPDKEPDLGTELNLPCAPMGHGHTTLSNQDSEGLDIPTTPKTSVRSSG